MSQSIIDIENELYYLRTKLFNAPGNDTSIHKDDPVLLQFADILDTYEQKVNVIKKQQEKKRNQGNTSYASRQDALDVEQIKKDLTALRLEIEQSDVEDGHTSATCPPEGRRIGHIETTTKTNTCGGSKRKKHKILLPKWATGNNNNT